MTTTVDPQALIESTGAPADTPVETIDVRSLGPPQPLRKTLETLASRDGIVLLQRNDRAPQHLYPKLSDRGYEYETLDRGDEVVTVIWEA